MASPRSSTAIRILFVLVGVALAAFFPFLALVLRAHGLDARQIGLVVGVMALARIAANPVWGHAADTWMGRKHAMQLSGVASAAAATALFVSGDLPLAVIAASAVLAAASGSFVSTGDALALAHLGEERAGDYGRVRGWMSFGYAVANVGLGFTLQAFGANAALVVYAIASLCTVAWLLVVPTDAPQHKRGERFGSVGAVFRASRRFPVYLLGWLVIGIAFTAAWSFLALRIVSRGGGPLLVGLGAAFGGAIEVPTFRAASRITGRRGLRTTFALGCGVYAVGFLLWGLVSDPVVLSLLFPFEGAAFALLFASGVPIVGRLVPPALHATGQSIAGMTWMGLAPIIGGPVGGLVYESLGPVWLYAGASALCVAGAAGVWLTLADPTFARPPGRGDAGRRPGEAPPSVDAQGQGISAAGPAASARRAPR
jgi:MFS transporter, PPP family, 3-phenylpropionic acid transporter